MFATQIGVSALHSTKQSAFEILPHHWSIRLRRFKMSRIQPKCFLRGKPVFGFLFFNLQWILVYSFFSPRETFSSANEKREMQWIPSDPLDNIPFFAFNTESVSKAA